MNGLRLIFASALLTGLSACATLGLGSGSDLDKLSGDWDVDLRPDFSEPAEDQPMSLEVDRDGTVTGRFYDSPILAGRAGAGQDRICASFRTSDNTGAYEHAACLEDGMLFGQTWSEGREFVTPWTATRD